MTAAVSLTPSELVRFNSFLDKSNAEHPQCWVWTGAKARGGGRSGKYYRGDGYGIFQTTTLQPKTRRAHKLAFQIWIGPVPRSLQVQHTCDNSLCCNPDHLVLGTPAENSQRMAALGRMPQGLGHKNARLSDEQVREIRELCRKGMSYGEIATRFGISESHVRNIHHRRRRLNDGNPTNPLSIT